MQLNVRKWFIMQLNVKQFHSTVGYQKMVHNAVKMSENAVSDGICGGMSENVSKYS